MNKAVALIILVILVLLVAKCGHSIYSGISNFPEYATSEVLSKKYSQLIADIDEQLAAGTTLLSVSANLETINYPLETVYVALEIEQGDDIVIKGKEHRKSHSRFLINGFGYGRLGEQDVVIVTRPVDRFGLDDVVVFLEHDQ